MDECRSLFEDLSAELFYLIFEYLAPHDLLFAFTNLNRRFTKILAQQSLCLPNNRNMTVDLYTDYLTSIIPNHISQIVYLHLSERRAPHAVDLFLSKIPLETLTWPVLKAVTIEDVPVHILESLLSDSPILSNIHSFSLDIKFGRYHYFEYEGFDDFNILIPILNSLPELRSLYFCVTTPMYTNYASKFKQNCPSIPIYVHLHTMTINHCSKELLVELLDNGHLPKLRRLCVALSCIHDDIVTEPSYSIPLKQASVPELRDISINLFVGVAWLLSYFEDLQRSSQIERFNISGHVRFSSTCKFPRVTELQRWLLLNKSKLFTFKMKMSADYVLGADEIRENVFAEYRRATGVDSSAKCLNINIRYPEMSFSNQIEMNDTDSESAESENEDSNNTTRSSQLIPDEPIDDNIEEMEIVDLEYIADKLIENTKAVRRWDRLRKIILEGDYPDDNDIVGENIPYLLHIGQRSPYFRELYIDADLDFGRVLSLNVELGKLFISQLEIFYFTAKESNCSFGDLVQIIDTLFSHSSSSPVLKQLTLNVDGHPNTWLSLQHLIDQIGKILDRFPSLIHFTLYCQNASAYQNKRYNLSELTPQWYIQLLHSRSNSLKYRHKPNSLDIWL